jgi:hypothetical protein
MFYSSAALPGSNSDAGLFWRMMSFYWAIFAFFFWIAYYILVGLVIYSIYQVCVLKNQNPGATLVEKMPFKERIAYYITRVKLFFTG